MSSDPSDNLVVETSENPMDLDSISLSSGDYLESINTDETADNTETILVSSVETNESQEDNMLEKENNLVMTSEETGESAVPSSGDISDNDLISSHHAVAPSSSSNTKIQISSGASSGVQKVIGGKFITAKGQNVLQRPLSISNISSFKKPVVSIGGNGPRNVITKVVVSQSNSNQNQPIFLASADARPSFVKIVSSGQTSNVTKTITLAQAQKLGLLSSGKLQQILPSVTSGKSVMLNKAIVSGPKKVTMVKSPAKILPAPAPSQTVVVPQRLLVKDNMIKTNTGQLIRVQPSSLTSMGIQQIQLTGSNKVQFVRVVQKSSPGLTAIRPQIKPRALNIASIAASTSLRPQLKPRTISIAPGSSTSSNFLNKVTNVQPIITKLKQEPTAVSTYEQFDVPIANTISTSSAKCVLLPANYLSNLKLDEGNISVNSVNDVTSDSFLHGDENMDHDNSSVKSEDISTSTVDFKQQQGARTLEPNGIRPRKPCNCTKSMCLKLYCDCFANGEFCYQCNCNSCFNNIEHEDDRHHAIRQCLERNPQAFRPKIGKCLVGEGERRHTKGCNCKRSGCLKNYCECYEAKIPCSNNCKCIACRNVEENLFLRLCQSERVERPSDAWKMKLDDDDDHGGRIWSSKLAFSFMSENIVSATCQCILVQAEKAIEKDLEEEEVQKIILEEFGSCLESIIAMGSGKQTDFHGS